MSTLRMPMQSSSTMSVITPAWQGCGLSSVCRGGARTSTLRMPMQSSSTRSVIKPAWYGFMYVVLGKVWVKQCVQGRSAADHDADATAPAATDL